MARGDRQATRGAPAATEAALGQSEQIAADADRGLHAARDNQTDVGKLGE